MLKSGCPNCKDNVIYQDTLLILLQGYRKCDHNQAISSAEHIAYLYEELRVSVLFNSLTEKVTINVLNSVVFKVKTYILYLFPKQRNTMPEKSDESFYVKTFIIHILPHSTVSVFLGEWDFSGGAWGRGEGSIKVPQNVLFTIKPET